jgi:hypothetical protein
MEVEFDFSELTRFAERLNGVELDKTFRRISKDISKALIKRMKGFTPVLDYDLINGWNENKLLVTETARGYEVLIVNKMEYAPWVNDGHSQRPGRFIPGYWLGVKRFVYDRNAKGGMVLKKSWVKGVFFVEKGIVSIKSVSEIEQIIMRELQKWWDSV